MKSVNSLSLTLFLGLLVPGQVFGMFGGQRYQVVNGRKVPVGQTPGASSSKAADLVKLAEGLESRVDSLISTGDRLREEAAAGSRKAQVLGAFLANAETTLATLAPSIFGGLHIFNNPWSVIEAVLVADIATVEEAFGKPNTEIGRLQLQDTRFVVNANQVPFLGELRAHAKTLRSFVARYHAVGADRNKVVDDFKDLTVTMFDLVNAQKAEAEQAEHARITLAAEARAAEEEARRTGRPAAAPAPARRQ